jgi:DNA repair protein RecN (Recombination protein N)
MLQSLYIENFVLIDRLEIDFHARMSVFTGETGAGKSIIIGALSLALGNRADTQAIGPFSDQTEIIAEFNLNNNPIAQKWLHQQDLLNSEENSTETLIIRRTFNQQGRSKQWVNGKPTPSGSVKELSQYLVQIHGQHDQIRLLKNQHQLFILDQFGEYELVRKQTAEAVKKIQEIETKLTDLTAAGSMSKDQVQLLQYQFDELDQLALTENEYESLHESLKTASHAQELIETINNSIVVISEDDSSIENQLTQVINQLKHAKGHDFKVIYQMLEESLINISEAHNELKSMVDTIENNPDDLPQIEDRLEKISHIARKQRVMPELLFQQHLDLSQTLAIHADLANSQKQLNQQLGEAMQQYRQLAKTLSEQRTKASAQLAKNITEMIRDLGLPEATFSVEVTHQADAKPRSLGNDHIEFMIAANKGQKAQPLNKTASGGELSRISLAIEVSTQQQNQNQAFVFDEVDTGIGGATAEKVGRIMQQLSENNQVFAVTHLPQVAGHAHDHLLVSKSSHGQYTTSKIAHLDQEQRIQELARMSGGQNITAATLAQAKEFLKTGS